MKHYNQLSSEQRYQISGLLKAGYKAVAIATEIGVNKSTISRELKRNRGHRGWRPKQAQAMRDERRRSCINAQRFTLEDWACVEDLIQRKFSPEQAAERLALEGNLRISPETIYRRVNANKRQGGDLWQQLRCQKPYRKRYGSGQERRGVITVARFQQLFLLAISQGKQQPVKWAAFVWQLLAAQGQKIVKEGKTLETADENLAELMAQAQTFAEKQLPILKALQIV